MFRSTSLNNLRSTRGQYIVRPDKFRCMTKPTRRAFLASLTATGVGIACNPETPVLEPVDQGPPTRADEPWSGVSAPVGDVAHIAVGDPSLDSVIVVGRVPAEASATVHWSQWNDGWAAEESMDLVADDAGYIRVTFTGLTAGLPIAVQITTADASSTVVQGRMPPQADARTRVTILAGSCSSQQHVDFPSLTRAIERGSPDLYIGLGDTVYQDNSQNSGDFRRLWMQNLQSPSYRALFANTLNAFTWDDHEVDNNFDPADTERMDLGRDRMREVLPITIDPDHPNRLWRKLSMGSTVDVFMMDMRSERRPEELEFVSQDQLEWLVQGIAESSATWKLICAPVPISRLPGLLEAEVARNDTWKGDAYNEQRLAFLAAIDGISGVLILTGDHHMPAVSTVTPSGPGSRTWEVFTGPLGSFRAPSYILVPDSPQLLWRAQQWTTTKLEFSANGVVEVTFIGEDDETWFQALFTDNGEMLDIFTTYDPMQDA
jgi:phosphodiesterase/alkaline phosphatase D-like protein